jgi:lipid A ethanolaminephosphotransferase
MSKAKRRSFFRREIPLFWFVMALDLVNLALFQKPLLAYALQNLDLAETQGMVQMLSIEIVQIGLYAFIMFLLSVVSVRLMKVVAAILFITNAMALYFMLTYTVEIDRSMIANIFNTTPNESFAFISTGMVVYVVFLGLFPAALLMLVPVRRPKWYWRALLPIISLLTLAGFLFATSTTWLWYDKHAPRMGSKVLPWSYVVNLGRHFNYLALSNRTQIDLPPASFTPATPERKQIVVLVIGESARSDNFSLYGYERNTNPFTAELGIVALPQGISCATNTIAATACLLTHEGHAASARTTYEPLPNYLTRQGIETFYRTNNNGPPPIKVDHYAQAADIKAECGTACPEARDDAILNWNLKELLQSSDSDRIFLTLHPWGSHGPSYWDNYPPEFAHFQPECKTVEVAKCTNEELTNAYDNTIRYMDYLLADVITQLKAIDNADVAMIYVSDHGQSLGENGVYLHGLPNAIAPEVQRHVPFLVWMSDSFKASHGLTNADIIPEETFPHDFPFHSIMGAFGMTSEIYKPEYDIFHLRK